MRLTDKFIKGTPAAGDYSDELVRGFFLRVGAGGAKSFGVRYRSPVLIDEKSHGKRQRYTIGTTSAWSLSDAREKARSILQMVAEGADPQAKKVDARAVGHGVETVADILERYIEKIRSDERPRERADGTPHWERERALRKYVFPRVGGIQIDRFKRRHAMEMHRAISRANGATMADRAVETLRTALNWAHDQELADDVPIFRFRSEAKKNGGRHRVLTTDELRAVWHACGDGPFGGIVQLLILTGQRRGEVAGMTTAELNGSSWELSPGRTKNGMPHLVPLSPLALEIIGRQPKYQGCDYVFTSNGYRQFSGWSRSKERLDRRAGISAWTLHDLRRTFVTHLNEMGTPPHVVETCVNHITGNAKIGVAGIYNKAQYLDERIAATFRWSDHIVEVIK